MKDETLMKALMERRPVICEECSKRLKYIGGGYYECMECGHTQPDDFGLVKDFIDANGPSPAIIISENTGVPVAIINGMLREGRLEIPEDSPIYLKCEKCGCAIRYGKFCPDCIKARTNNLKGVYFNPEVGEKPKKTPQAKPGAKMRFLDIGK